MAGSRGPRDTADKYLFRKIEWTHSDGITYSYDGVVGKNIRPWYPYTRPVVLRGGTKFRPSTEYLHWDTRLEFEGSYRFKAFYIDPWGPSTISIVGNREVPALHDYWGGNDRASIFGIPNDMRNEAVTKALNKIADQKANLGENLATLGQTTRLIANNTKSAADLLRAGVSGDFRKYLFKSYRQLRAEGIPETVARKYLEYVYGFKPLMEDTYGLLEMAKAAGKKDMLLEARGVSQRTEVASTSNWRHLSHSRYRRISSDAKTKVKCSLWATIDPDYQGLRSLNQLGLLNPLSLVWELVPWSFVVDWFLPIGPVLNALTAPAGLQWINGSLSTRNSQTTVYEYEEGRSPTYAPNETVVEYKPLTVTHLSDGFYRVPLHGWPLPGLWIDPDPLRGDRVFKAAALALLNLGGSRAGLAQSGY